MIVVEVLGWVLVGALGALLMIELLALWIALLCTMEVPWLIRDAMKRLLRGHRGAA